jgi:ElaA protein
VLSGYVKVDLGRPLSREGGVQIGDGISLEWHDFTGLPAGLLYEVLRFRQAIFVVEQACAYPDLDGLDRRAHHLLLHADGALAGYLRLVPHPDEHRVSIGRVAVGPSFRHRGFAGRLMTAALSRCARDWPGLAVGLSAQAHLTSFYESLGFGAIAPPYDDYGVPHIEMVLAERRGLRGSGQPG